MQVAQLTSLINILKGATAKHLTLDNTALDLVISSDAHRLEPTPIIVTLDTHIPVFLLAKYQTVDLAGED